MPRYIQLARNRYEVEVALIGKTVECRYDPFSLAEIHVSFQGRAYADATPLVLRHHRHREVPTTDRPPSPPATGLNLAQLANARQQAAQGIKQARIRYAQPPHLARSRNRAGRSRTMTPNYWGFTHLPFQKDIAVTDLFMSAQLVELAARLQVMVERRLLRAPIITI